LYKDEESLDVGQRKGMSRDIERKGKRRIGGERATQRMKTR
jgi:hypothetical protein